jgi:hypothetical protein
MSLNKPTPERILAAVQVELTVIVKRLIACRNLLYRQTGTYPDDLGAAIYRLDFLLHDIMTGLVSPADGKADDVKTPSAKPVRGSVQ